MWPFFICLAIGITIGLYIKLPKNIIKYNSWLQKLGIVLLLFSMGASIGANRKVLHEIRSIGIESLVFAVTACIFSVAVTFLITKRFMGDKKEI